MKRLALNYLIIATVIFVATFTSCKDKGGNVEESDNVKLLKSITFIPYFIIRGGDSDDGVVTEQRTKFEYDNQNRIVKIHRHDVYNLKREEFINSTTITYKTNDLVTVATTYPDKSTGITEFAKNGKTIKVTYNGMLMETLTINKDGYIVKVESDAPAIYQYKDGNWFDTNPDITYEYDSKKSPFSNTGTLKWLLRKLGYSADKNNVSFYGWQGGEITGYIEYKYEYDSDGFPVKQTAKTYIEGEEWIETTHFTYRVGGENAPTKAENSVEQTDRATIADTATTENEPVEKQPVHIPIRDKDIDPLKMALSKWNEMCDQIINMNVYTTESGFEYHYSDDEKELAATFKQLANKDPLSITPNEFAKFKKVRSIQAHAMGIFVYPYFSCAFTVSDNRIYFRKTAGSQRVSGNLYRVDGNSRADENLFVFLGGYTVNDDPLTSYGNEENSAVGMLYRVSAKQLILIFTDRGYGLEMYEIIK